MSKFAVADTEYGKVKGIVKASELDQPYLAFLGVRYAAPPVKDLRFKVCCVVIHACPRF